MKRAPCQGVNCQPPTELCPLSSLFHGMTGREGKRLCTWGPLRAEVGSWHPSQRGGLAPLSLLGTTWGWFCQDRPALDCPALPAPLSRPISAAGETPAEILKSDFWRRSLGPEEIWSCSTQAMRGAGWGEGRFSVEESPLLLLGGSLLLSWGGKGGYVP